MSNSDKTQSANTLSQNEASSESPNEFSTTNFNPNPLPEKESLNDPSKDIPLTPVPPTVHSATTEEPPLTKNVPVNEFITTSGVGKSGNKNNFLKFVVLGVIIIALVYGGVFFLYVQNKKIKGSAQTETADSSNSVGNLPTPTPEFKPENVKVVNGNIVYEDPASEAKVLVSKSNYPATGITGFAKVTVSPDNSLICFEALPPAPSPALYIAKADGTEVKEIGANNVRCIFTVDSKKILYEDLSQRASNIKIYDIANEAESLLTSENSDATSPKAYHLVGLSADGSKAICNYEDLELENVGQCEIDLNTSAVTLN